MILAKLELFLLDFFLCTLGTFNSVISSRRFFALFAIFYLGTIGDGDQNINQEGYFKQNQNRIFSFSFKEYLCLRVISLTDVIYYYNTQQLIFQEVAINNSRSTDAVSAFAVRSVNFEKVLKEAPA